MRSLEILRAIGMGSSAGLSGALFLYASAFAEPMLPDGGAGRTEVAVALAILLSPLLLWMLTRRSTRQAFSRRPVRRSPESRPR